MAGEMETAYVFFPCSKKNYGCMSRIFMNIFNGKKRSGKLADSLYLGSNVLFGCMFELSGRKNENIFNGVRGLFFYNAYSNLTLMLRGRWMSAKETKD